MGTQGDAILVGLVKADIHRLESAGDKSPCTHCGMLTMLKCKLAELECQKRSGSGFTAAGWGTVASTLIYLVLKAHNVVP